MNVKAQTQLLEITQVSIRVFIFFPSKRLFMNLSYETRVKSYLGERMGCDDGGGSKQAPFGAAR